MPKRYLTGGGKDLKNRCKSYGYLFKFFNIAKIEKILTEKTGKLSDRNTYNTGTGTFPGKLSDRSTYNTGTGTFPGKPSYRCTEKNTASSVTLVNKKLTFAEYDKIEGVDSRAKEGTGAEILCNISAFIKKIIAVSKRIRSDRYTEKNTGSGVTLVNKKLTFAEYDRIGEADSRAANVEREMLESTDHYVTRGFWDIARTFRAAKFVSELKSILINFNEKIDSRAQEGPGASHSWKFFLTSVCREIEKFVSRMKCRPLLLRAANSGAILIEFAVCMPVLIILLFYINDLIRFKRYYSQTEFVAQQIANILQNISQKRDNKKITRTDIKYAMTLANQTIYPGKTMFKQGSGHPMVHTPVVRLFYITKDQDTNTASSVWELYLYSINISTPPTNIYYAVGNWGAGLVTNAKNVAPSQIYHSLKVGSEPKLIVESSLVFNYYTKDYNVNGQYVSNKDALGLHIINPQRYSAWYFPSVVIFTPKPGLFDETAPS